MQNQGGAKKNLNVSDGEKEWSSGAADSNESESCWFHRCNFLSSWVLKFFWLISLSPQKDCRGSGEKFVEKFIFHLTRLLFQVMLTGDAPATVSAGFYWGTFGLLKFRVTWDRFHFLIGTWCVLRLDINCRLFTSWMGPRLLSLRWKRTSGSSRITCYCIKSLAVACKQVRFYFESGRGL